MNTSADPGAAAGGKTAAGARTVITIDGPAASGKSSVAQALARQLGFAYVSSGLLYRAATLVAMSAGCDEADERALLALLARRDVVLEPSALGNRVSVGGKDVTAELHTDAVDTRVSTVAKHHGVREWVNERLRELGGSFVIDGRDMGTVVFPDAAAKFYLTADPLIRARRRANERHSDVGAIAAELERRDARDELQSAPAHDATVIDTGGMSLAEVVERVRQDALLALADAAVAG